MSNVMRSLKKFHNDEEFSGAEFSDCRWWRYTLWRSWSAGGDRVAFIGLNPSTADETKDDPTVRRCINYAKSWGYGGMTMLNMFAYRATDPKEMKAEENPVGPDNDDRIILTAKLSALVVCAWGVHGRHRDRDLEIVQMLTEHGVDLHCLKVTKDGCPGHPLYLKKDLKPILLTEALKE